MLSRVLVNSLPDRTPEGGRLVRVQPAEDCKGKVECAFGQALRRKSWPEVEGRTDREFLADKSQAEVIMATDRRVMQSGESEGADELVDDDTGPTRVWLSTETPLRNAANEVIGLVGTSVNISDQKHAGDRQRRMDNKLDHRVNNMFAKVLSITGQTFARQGPGDP